MPRVMVGLVGCGFVAELHTYAYKRVYGIDAEVTAVVARGDHVLDFAKKHNIRKTYRDFRDLLDDGEINVIDICTPPALHAPMIVDAVQAGKHVICEKPFAGYFGRADDKTPIGKHVPKSLMYERVLEEMAKTCAAIKSSGQLFMYAEDSGATRFSVGAVNVRSGNFAYFDNDTHTIRPEHIMASGALPPGFPAVEIEGEYYWDGGLVSNTPLQWVVETEPRRDTLAFQVDLWNARGEFPRNIFDVMTREKEIRYSSRTRAGTDQFKHIQKLRHALAGLLDKMPEELKNTPEARLLGTAAERKVYNIVHLIYRAKNYEGDSKDYEFSRLSMQEHWRAGYHDARRTLRHPEVLKRPDNHEGVFTFDLAQNGRE